MLTAVRNQTMKNPILKFGDALLLCVALALASVSVISFSGCALLSKGSSQEQKLSDIHNLAYAAASIGTSEALLENAVWRLHFETAYVQLDRLVEQKIVTGDLLRGIIASLPVRELRSDRARIAIESATFLFDQTVGTKIDIEKAQFVLAAATGIRDGMRVALRL